MTKAKIIATLGPASEKTDVVLKMIEAGMDVVRLNFSHGIKEEHLKKIKLLRKINKKSKSKIKILADLEGYRIRIGELKGGQSIQVKKGQRVLLTKEAILGAADLIPFDYTGDLNKIKKGQMIYIDDGNIALVVDSLGGKVVKTNVVIPGIIKEHKGINMPGVKFDFAGLTEKDRTDLRFCAQNKADYIAQSFVRCKNDIVALKKELAKYRYECKIIAKIENREGIENLDEIMSVCNGIMIARGDLGVSIPIYEVPLVQKSIINKCKRAGKIVITATQMLESMTQNHIPTRAEVSDVANAILDGSDYVMLSAETAVGNYPVETVEMMNKIIDFTERHRINGNN